MSIVKVELDRELVNLLYHNQRSLEDTLKEYVVLELYRRNEVSSGKAAELLAMGREEFIHYASRLGIPYLDMSDQELQNELLTVRGGG